MSGTVLGLLVALALVAVIVAGWRAETRQRRRDARRGGAVDLTGRRRRRGDE
jgi:hypothetical protein